ncbi:craniofacial development protein 2-like [Penaeus japonicus]|uniref:craniofacial development protein 2-like n=1 Tax=Penaeus japonicus TaxID=27405 RepID=UPI001C7158E9|nr:craniofacial development protein 2-like [Penaeus japonicus]
MRENQQNTILDRSGPRIKTAATAAVGQQGSSGKYVTVSQPRNNRRGGNRETKWKGSKARDQGAGYKLYYHGENGARNGVGVVVRGMHPNGVLEVRRITDRMMSLKLEIDVVLLNVVCACAPQMESDREEKEEFWEKLDEAVELIPKEERFIIGADFNGHVGEGNSGDERVKGKYGYGACNNEGQTIVDFAHRTDMAVINTFYSKVTQGHMHK